MGGAPVIVWLREGVGYAPDAAASMRRLERALGREHDCNSSYRDYAEQKRMFDAWTRYVNSGYDPRYKPNHSRALNPDDSMHCRGLADDSDDWTTPGYIELAAERGWIRTAANDPTERHHFEYQWWNDQHRNDPDPEEDDMFTDEDRAALRTVAARMDDSVLTNLTVIKGGVNGLLERTDDSILPTLTIIRAQGAQAGGVIDVTALANELREGLGDVLADELGRRLTR